MRACTCMNACKFQKGPPAIFFILPFCVSVRKIRYLRLICTNGGILASVALDYWQNEARGSYKGGSYKKVYFRLPLSLTEMSQHSSFI